MIKIKTGFNLAIYLSVFSFCVMRFLACLHHHPGAVHRIGFLIDGGIYYVWSHFLGLYCVFNVDILLDWCFSSWQLLNVMSLNTMAACSIFSMISTFLCSFYKAFSDFFSNASANLTCWTNIDVNIVYRLGISTVKKLRKLEKKS